MINERSLISPHSRTPDPTDILDTYSSSERYESSTEEKEILAALEQRFQEAAQYKRSFDEEVLLNQRVLNGNLIPARSVDSGESVFISLTDTSRQEWSKYISTDNVTRNINRALVGKHTRVVPGVEVSPATTDEADVESAEIATTALEAAARVNKLRAKWVRAHLYMGPMGNGILELSWNKQKGRVLAKCPQCNYIDSKHAIGDPCPVCQMRNQVKANQETMQRMQEHLEQGKQEGFNLGDEQNVPEPIEPEPAPIMEVVREGEVWVDARDPRTFFPEPAVMTIEDMRYCCTVDIIPLSTVANMFPKMAPFLRPEAGADARTLNPTVGGIPNYTYDRVALYTWHFMPSALHPEGRIIYVANEIILNQIELEDGTIQYGEPHPYHFIERLPFYLIKWEHRNDQFWGESHITQSKWSQFEHNDLLRDMREQRRLTFRPPLLAPTGSMVSQEDFYNFEPGTVIKWNSMNSQRPDWLQPPEFPAYTYNEVERTRQACMAAASVTDQEMGMTSGEPSGRYAAILEAQSSESLRAIMILNSDQWLELHRGMLLIMQEYYSADKVWTVRGKGKWMSYNWSAVNLMHGWDVLLSETDSLSKNPALRLEQSERLYGIGYFNDPNTGAPDMDYFGRLAGIQDSRRASDPDANMRSYARALPEMIMRNKFPGVMPWDNAKMCADELLSWLRGPGRKQPIALISAVAQVWQLYMIAYQMRQQQLGLPIDPDSLPTQAQQPPQQQQQAQPGGSAGGPQSNNIPGNPAQEAAQTMRRADATGENLARPGKHE